MNKTMAATVIILAAPYLSAAEIYNKDANKLDFYGSVQARHYFSNYTGSDGDNSYIRFGFKGQTQINDQLTGYGQWEYNVQTNHTEGGSDALSGNKTRLGFAGLKWSNFGSLDYGRNWGVLYDVASITDIAAIFDDLTYSYSDSFMSGRSTGLLTYRNNNFFGLADGLKFAVQYQGANDENSNDARMATKANGDGYGFSSSYTFDWGGAILGAYSVSNRTKAQQQLAYGRGDKAENWATGLKYNAHSLYLATLYSETHNMAPIGSIGMANKAQNMEAVAQYLFDFGLQPEIGYFQSKGKQIEGYGDVDLIKYADLGLTYFFNKNMSVYADYKINLLKDDNPMSIAADDVFGLGLSYRF
ncbi:porin [Sodalis sp. RH19]|uniref:porin n=1 Tax=unclassified Sodalis (in: enterobacteria) TaxID=2636512 RepID=UPI0039B63497